MSVPIGEAFDPASLEANRRGALSAGQRAAANQAERTWRSNALAFAGIAVVIGLLVATSNGGNYPQIARYGVAAVAFAIAIVLVVLRVTPDSNPLARDLHDGRVATVEGAFGKTTGRGERLTFYYFELGDRRFEVSQAAYHAAPDYGVMRLYILPSSHRVVNFEHLADRPVPEGGVSAGSVAKALVSGMAGMHQAQRLETMASLAALGHSLEGSATPPSAGERDPRPLAEAVLGSWKWAAAQVTFAGDGTASLTLPGGRSMQGRWSVSGEGRLHVTGAGEDITGDAWVAGDTLTVVQDGRAMAFHRAG